MSSNAKKLIAVIGATGQQGGGVVRALQAGGEFTVRGRGDRHGRAPRRTVLRAGGRGLLAWLGPYLRELWLRELIPLRQPTR